MIPIVILIKVLLIHATAINCTGETSNEIALSSDSKRDKLVELDIKILELLKTKSSLQDFIAGMRAYGVESGSHYYEDDLTELYDLFSSVSTYNKPCNEGTLSHFANHEVYFRRFKNKDLREILNYLVRDDPAARYTDKCIDEFDATTLEHYEEDEDAIWFMSKLANLIDMRTRHRMIVSSIRIDLDPFRELNKNLRRLIKSFRFYLTCHKVERIPRIKEIRDIMTQILGSTSNLRTDGVIRRLNKQILATSPNTIKLMSLIMFCQNIMGVKDFGSLI